MTTALRVPGGPAVLAAPVNAGVNAPVNAGVDGRVTSRAAVLVVQHDPDQRELLAIHLRRAGCAVTTLATGEDALETLDSGAVDLALVDTNLPGISATVVARVIGRRQPGCTVVLTSELDPDQLTTGQPSELPGLTVLTLPITRTELLGLLPVQRRSTIPQQRTGSG